jgi:hypothetical protein
VKAPRSALRDTCAILHGTVFGNSIGFLLFEAGALA